MEGEFKINKVMCDYHSSSNFRDLFDRRAKGRTEDEYFNYVINAHMCKCMSHLVKTREQYLMMLKWYLGFRGAAYYRCDNFEDLFPNLDEYLTESEICQYLILIPRKQAFEHFGGKYHTNINCIKLCLTSQRPLPKTSFNVIYDNPEILFEIEPQYVAGMYLDYSVSVAKENMQNVLAILSENTDYICAYVEACKINSAVFEKLIEILCESDYLNISSVITCSPEQKKILKEKGYKVRLKAGSTHSKKSTEFDDSDIPYCSSSQGFVKYIESLHEKGEPLDKIFGALSRIQYSIYNTDIIDLSPIIATFSNKYKNLVLFKSPHLYPHIGKVTLTTAAFDTKLEILDYCDYKGVKKSTLVSVINKHTKAFVEKYPEILENKDLVKAAVKYKPHILKYVKNQVEYKEDLLRFIKKKHPAFQKLCLKMEILLMHLYITI